MTLIVDNARTSKFYLLPKIHQAGNPGRPIVSACNCPTELIATYLDAITTPLVQNLPSYVKDTKHMLRITGSFRFHGEHNYVFTMDVKSLYTTIPKKDGVLALTHFLNKRLVPQPPTHSCSPRRVSSHIEYFLFQWKVLQPNRRGRYGESTWAQLCVPVYGSLRRTNL